MEGAQSSVAAIRDAQCWLTADHGRGVSGCELVRLLSLSHSQEGKDGRSSCFRGFSPGSLGPIVSGP